MTSGNLDANWSEDPIQQPALNLIVIDKPLNTDPRGGGCEGGIKSLRRSNGVSGIKQVMLFN